MGSPSCFHLQPLISTWVEPFSRFFFPFLFLPQRPVSPLHIQHLPAPPLWSGLKGLPHTPTAVSIPPILQGQVRCPALTFLLGIHSCLTQLSPWLCGHVCRPRCLCLHQQFTSLLSPKTWPLPHHHHQRSPRQKHLLGTCYPARVPGTSQMPSVSMSPSTRQ